MKMRLVWLLLGLCGPAQADDETQRQDLRRQRDAIEAQHAQREEACRRQFVVTPCLEKVRVDKQKALESVRTQELTLDDALRRQRAQAQAQRLAGKAAAAQARDDKPVAAPRPPKPPRVPASRVARPSATKASAVDRRAEEKREREAFEARQREIQAHRDAVAKRNAERAGRKPAIPLPVPSGASARP